MYIASHGGTEPVASHNNRLYIEHHMEKQDLLRLTLPRYIRGLLEKYPTFGREKETGLLGALDT